MEGAKGSEEVREFYDRRGWKEDGSGRLVDSALFGVREDGDIRRAAHARRVDRIRAALRETAARLGASGLDLLECGCGGDPAVCLADLCRSYTAVDFSTTGLAVARKKLGEAGSPQGTTPGLRSQALAADACGLPFADASFDAVYSAHMLYHIPSADAQARAMDELMRVVRPGGGAVLVLANPRPLMFPLRTMKRIVADLPGAAALAATLGRKAPLPYKPMPLGWTRRRLRRHGEVAVTAYAVASTWFNQKVTERKGLGRWLWKRVAALESGRPELAARLGNYVTVIVKKTPR